MKYAALKHLRTCRQNRKGLAHGISSENTRNHSRSECQNDYTAKNIKVLSSEEAENQFGWLKAGKLAAKYHKPLAFIERGLEAYRLAGASAEAFEDRYLKKLPDAPKNHEAELISIELQRKA